MADFPRTKVGQVSVSRMIIGTNWFLGYTHSTAGQSRAVQRIVTHRDAIADIIETFLNEGVDTIMCPHTTTCMYDAIQEAEQRTGKRLVIIETPSFPTNQRTPFDGFDLGEVERILDEEVKKGVSISMPHTSTTDVMVDKCTREVRQMDAICTLIRQRGMEPGLSTHIPETVIFADETGLDVETYIQPYNALGFLMQIEVDWVARLIQKAKKPVMTIKTMAAGQIRPFQAMTFVWNTIRDMDMVTVGTMAPEEARELVDLSREILAKKPVTAELQKTRSKATLTG
ncbi:MAG: hypothetical protein P1S60_16890 [Anaerolineae bacterium]|nr:hypothetical protein [Anaerolineae bacterium]